MLEELEEVELKHTIAATTKTWVDILSTKRRIHSCKIPPKATFLWWFLCLFLTSFIVSIYLRFMNFTYWALHLVWTLAVLKSVYSNTWIGDSTSPHFFVWKLLKIVEGKLSSLWVVDGCMEFWICYFFWTKYFENISWIRTSNVRHIDGCQAYSNLEV